jgi:hypothetical protein
MRKAPKRTEAFVKVPLWWIETASKATRAPRAMLLAELLHAAWRAKKSTFPLPNGKLRELGVSREVKRKTLQDLERAKLIVVERPDRKTVVVTLCML